VSTFLELCADLTRESGAIGAAPSTVIGQHGRQLKCVNWVRQAWTQIQNEKDWIFKRNDFSGALSIGVTDYAPATFAITSHSKWLIDTEDYQPVTLYESGFPEREVAIRYISYERWKSLFGRGVHDGNQPVYYSISPANHLLVGPKPDKPYVIKGEYLRGPQTLAVDGDIPIMPAEYHEAITWRAAVMLAEHDEAKTARDAAALKYDPIYNTMLRDLLPGFVLGGNQLA
jgi:hypothetical protein